MFMGPFIYVSSLERNNNSHWDFETLRAAIEEKMTLDLTKMKKGKAPFSVK